jgi:hypothetical protein
VAGPCREYPVARPYAPPPPTSPYYRPEYANAVFSQITAPASPQPVGRRVPEKGAPRRTTQILVLAGFALVCMGVGWFCFQGPGRSLFGGKQATAEKKPTDTTAVADAGTIREDNKAPVRPPDNPTPDKPTPVKPTPKPPADPVVKQPPPAPPPPDPMPKPPQPPAGTPVLTFERHVAPILETRCISCHGATRKRAGLDLRTVAAMLKGGENGPGLVPGKLDQGTLWQSIVSNQMPPGQRKLSAEERKTIQDWIVGGARTAQTAGR